MNMFFLQCSGVLLLYSLHRNELLHLRSLSSWQAKQKIGPLEAILHHLNAI